MNKKIRKAVFDRATPDDGLTPICEGCDMEIAIECHHSIGGTGKRKVHESVESCYALGSNCHRKIESKDGHDLRIYLILKTQQRYFDMGLSEDAVREKMGGKLYFNWADMGEIA